MTGCCKSPTILHAFEYWEQTTPDTVYLTQPFTDDTVVEYTCREVGNQVRRMAAHLKSLDLPDKSHITIVGKNSAHWIMADLAIWMAGHVSVPVFPIVNAATAEHVGEHSEARLMFVGKLDGVNDTWNDFKHDIADDLPKIAMPMSPLPDAPQWDAIVADNEPLTNIDQPDLKDLATIVYTSGSTGQPKGVMHSFGTMITVAHGMEEQFQLTSDDRMLSYLPLAHVAECAAIETMSLYYGFQVFLANNLDTFQHDLKRARPTLFFSVPRLWTKFYQGVQQKLPLHKQRILFKIPIISGIVKRTLLSKLGLDHTRVALTGSAPLAPAIIRWYHELGLELLDVYAMSENFAYSHASRPGQTRIGYVGSPAPGVVTRIAENGEIQVKSPGQMIGYYKMPEKTAEDMTEDGFFKTGDMGEIDDQNRPRITGRVKELFKTSKGKYVAPVPIESRLGDHPDIEVVCVTGVEQPQPFAPVMLAEERQLEHERGTLDQGEITRAFTRLREEVNADLPHEEQLAFLVVVQDAWTMEDNFLTPTMKIKRNVIEDRYAGRADEWLAMKKTRYLGVT